MSAAQLRRGRVLTSLLVLMLGPALLPASAAAAASGDRTGVATARSSTGLSGFDTARASVRVGGAVWDNVTVLPRAARTVTVQYRLAGAARFTNASSGVTSARGLFAARLQPRSAGVWQFRLVVPATSRADKLVSAIRTVRASGRAAATSLRGLTTAPASVTVGGVVRDAVTVLPTAARTVQVQAQQPGARSFALVSTGTSSRAGAYTVAYRPMKAGVWHYRLVLPASATARGFTSSARTVTATTPAPTPPAPTPTSPAPAPGDVTPPGPVTALTALATTADGVAEVTLSWTNPTDSDFAGVMIRRAAGATAPTHTTGTLVVTNTAPAATSYHNFAGLAAGTQYTYAVFAHDGVPNHSVATNVTVTTIATRTTAVLSINGSTGPTAKLTQNVSVGDPFLVVNGSHASPGQILISGTLDFGDGSDPQVFTGDPQFWIPVAYAYKKVVPVVMATLTVTDSAGVIASTTIDVGVFPEPTVKITEVGTATAGQPVTFHVTTDIPAGTVATSYDFVSFTTGTDPTTGLPNVVKGSVFAAPGAPPVVDTLTLTFTFADTYFVDITVDTDAATNVTDTATVHVQQ
jgi:hypothetical protein